MYTNIPNNDQQSHTFNHFWTKRRTSTFHPATQNTSNLGLSNDLNFSYGLVGMEKEGNISQHQYLDPSILLYDLQQLQKEIAADFLEGLFTHKTPFTRILLLLYSLIFTVGLVGNSLVILVMLRHRHMRTTTNMFLVNLSIGDLLVVVVCMPFTLASYVYKNWIYGVVVCKLTPFVQGISVGVSVLTLLAVSLDRCYAIYKPMRARVFLTKLRVKVVLVTIWVIAMVISCPLLFVNEVKTRGLQGIASVKTCEETWLREGDRNLYNLCIFILLYTIPLLVMTTAYSKIGQILWNGDQVLTRSRHTRSSVDSQACALQLGRRRVVRMLVFVVVMFALSWMPYHVVNIYLDLNPGASRRAFVAMYVYPICQWLALANSSSNPICFCFLSRSFRDAFRSLFCCCGCGESDSALSTSQRRNFRNQMYTRVSTYSVNSSRRFSKSSPYTSSRKLSPDLFNHRREVRASFDSRFSRSATPSPRASPRGSKSGFYQLGLSRSHDLHSRSSSISSTMEHSDHSYVPLQTMVDYSQPTLELPKCQHCPQILATPGEIIKPPLINGLVNGCRFMPIFYNTSSLQRSTSFNDNKSYQDLCESDFFRGKKVILFESKSHDDIHNLTSEPIEHVPEKILLRTCDRSIKSNKKMKKASIEIEVTDYSNLTSVDTKIHISLNGSKDIRCSVANCANDMNGQQETCL